MTYSEQELRRLGSSLVETAGDLGAKAAAAISESVPFYRDTASIGADDLLTSCTENLRFVFSALASGKTADTTAASETGVRRARAAVPLHEVMTAYRVGFRSVWEPVIIGGRNRPELSAQTLLEATARVVAAQDSFTDAMAIAYSREQASLVRVESERRSALIAGLLTGSLVGGRTLWEIADTLGLPNSGPYVVVAVSCADVGRSPMPTVADELGHLAILSVWQLMPNAYVGVVHLRNRSRLPQLITVLERLARTSVGVSGVYDNLAQTGEALRLARIASAGTPRGVRVTVFDAAPLAIAAGTDPPTMRAVASGVFAGLPDDERDMLLDTIEAWFECAGSASDAAARLYCHPNTVRHRLHRVEKHIAKSFTNPRHVAEMCVALEVARRFGLD
ncbi:PucR family transcriptional regulator [Gordonia sp. TBRC 11910]|uniref:PucR family transcriptional regulator n=1 Tax=Gordonia asplenii TaxID=2725283 RepID=A0A848LA17_9ACTN|nr:helix-turn-helix domain-containing protein [Gordonia asplenii]NMO04418.1 PucR family transcriptional regulator [Gordonia asplenii]